MPGGRCRPAGRKPAVDPPVDRDETDAGTGEHHASVLDVESLHEWRAEQVWNRQAEQTETEAGDEDATDDPGVRTDHPIARAMSRA
jgi:hypothetical protein